MTRTHEKVSRSPESERREYTAVSAAQGIEQALGFLEGRWKLLILFHLFGGKVLRFSDLERTIPAISQKMLIQQLRQMEKDGVVRPGIVRSRSENRSTFLMSASVHSPYLLVGSLLSRVFLSFGEPIPILLVDQSVFRATEVVA